ncbi:MAG: HAD-IC family P-type ATPase, partial [Flavobacteriales bacterium]|nr:HAD-IC family P-type ATPase [Flavobacteriales bacterium]
VVDRWTDLTHNELAALAAIEQRSTHPLARALMNALPDPAGAAPIHAVTEVPGEGMQATVNGARWLVGNRRALESGGVRIDREHSLREREWQERGRTTVWVAANGQVRGLFALEDVLRSSAPLAIAALKETGIPVYMQTGDGARMARQVAAAVGIEHVRAEVSPKDKAAFVQGLREQGAVVAMVGDGVNDAAALAAADVSFAMGQGSDVAMGVAHITLLAGDLAALPKAVRLSRRTMRTIRQNLFWAFVYNVISIPVAAGVLQPALGFTLDPMWAGLAMAFSSISVVLNSLRLRIG